MSYRFENLESLMAFDGDIDIGKHRLVEVILLNLAIYVADAVLITQM